MIFEPLFLFFSLFNFILPDTLETSTPKISVHGAVDVYYAYDFNRPLDKNRQFTTQAARHNEFNINWAYLQISYKDDRVRGNLALHTGTYAIFNYADEPNPLLRLIAQANVGVRIAPNIWIDAGVMPSHIGYENTLSAENEIYTRSLMAEHSPYFSTGVQLTAGLSEKIKASFVVLNGWQNITETNESKSIGININYAPSSKLELNYSNYYGNEGNEIIGRKMRLYNHAYAKYQLTPKFHGAVSLDMGNQELFWNSVRRTWYTGMLIGQYRVTEKLSFAGRVEYYHDPHQIIIQTMTPRGFQTKSTTLNLNFSPSPNSIIRLEGRMYHSKDQVFNEGSSLQRTNYLLASSLTVYF